MKAFLSLSAAALLLATTAPFALADDDAPDSPVTFSNQVVRILQENCQSCHRPGDIGPMSLISYQDVRPWAKSIKKAVLQKDMPPWDAVPGPHTFANDVTLSEQQIATIVRWVDQGAPEGNPVDLPKAKQFDIEGWKIGKPDIVVTTPEYVLPADVADEYRCFVIPTNLTEDTWFTGVEYKPGNRQVVHHIIAFMDSTGHARAKDAESAEPGYICGMGGDQVSIGVNSMLGGWAPGNQPNEYRGNIGRLVKAGTDIIFQIHYHNTTGQSQPDSSSMAMFMAREPIRAEGRVVPVSDWNLDIKAGDPNAEASASWTVPKDVTVYSIMPHMHYLGKDMTVWFEYLDGRKEQVLTVPKYDFNWQIAYTFQEPIKLAKGMKVHMLAHHDNSADNPANPAKPPQNVKWGEATHEEMAIAWMAYTFDGENLNVEPKKELPISKNISSVK